MVTKKQIDDFYACNPIAVVGVSRKKQKFGYQVYYELKKKGKTILPVNPNTDKIDDDVCYRDVLSLPENVSAVVLLTRKEQTATVIKDVLAKGIRNIWIQQGAHTPEALELVKQADVNLIHGKCIMMFAEPVGGIHKFHRSLMKLFGMLPK